MSHRVVACIPEALAVRAQHVIEQIRAGELGPEDHARVVKLITDISEAVMHHFFIRPMPHLGVGMALRGVVKVGVGSAVKAIGMGLGRVVPKIDREHWTRIADFLDEAISG